MPGQRLAIRIEGVSLNLRATWRGRMRAAMKGTDRRFIMRVRGETIWFLCAEDEMRTEPPAPTD